MVSHSKNAAARAEVPMIACRTNKKRNKKSDTCMQKRTDQEIKGESKKKKKEEHGSYDIPQ